MNVSFLLLLLGITLLNSAFGAAAPNASVSPTVSPSPKATDWKNDLQELGRLISDPAATPEEVHQFIQSHVADISDLVSSELSEDGETVLGLSLRVHREDLFHVLYNDLGKPNLNGDDPSHWETSVFADGLRYGSWGLIEEMRKRGAVDLEKFTNDAPSDSESRGRTTDLIVAAGHNSADVIQHLLDEARDVNAVDVSKSTALMSAADSNTSAEVVRVLLKRGAQVDAQNTAGGTALVYATQDNRRIEILKALLEAHPDIHYQPSWGNPVLITATETWEPQRQLLPTVEYLQLLIDAGAQVDATDSQNRTALHCAAMSNSAEVVSFLLKKGLNVNQKETDGETPLYEAARLNPSVDVIQVLIAAHADLEVKDAASGDTPLTIATSFNPNEDVAAALVRAHADVHAMDVGGDTVLEDAAVARRSIGLMRLLISDGADLGHKDHFGKMALDYAQTRPQDVIDLLTPKAN